MTSKNLEKKERKEIADWFRVVSQVNRRSLEEMMRINRLAQESFSRQMLIQWQQIQNMQWSVLQYLRGIDMATISMIRGDILKSELTSLMKTVEISASAYRNYLENIRSLYQESILKEIAENARILTLAYANTIFSYRTFVEPKPKVRIKFSDEQSQIQEKVEQDIDSLLRGLDPNYLTMRVGAWTTFRAKGPDHLRQSVTSMRELLNHVLRKLSPGDITRKDRIRAIMSGNGKRAAEVDLIESMADYVDKLYLVLSKIAHTVYMDELSVEMALKATEAVLVVLLKKRITPE